MERLFGRWGKRGAWIEAQARNEVGNWQQKSPANPRLPRKILTPLALLVTIAYYLPIPTLGLQNSLPTPRFVPSNRTPMSLDNIRICLASDLVSTSKGISEFDMGPKDADFNLYRSILRNAGLLADQICLICLLDSKGQRRGIYSQSMFVAAVEYQINQAGVDDMITFHGCASAIS